ncbi:papain-like cysteine protease family protein [Acetoanaerobium noterae]|uniref:papain-like cysteine protease family protein n=1 Tax=Acetoanaerobium noterae TaxID=745369 RepID=UPI0028ADA37F|nr:papain-like cysteine protease family protein [Acetoanaerobium noterae]
MKKQIFAFVLTALVVGGSIVPSFADDNTTKDAIQSKPEMIKGLDYNEYAGADAYNNAGDNLNSKFYKAPDFYNMVSDEQIIIIPKFKTMQQTTEWSCGNVTALMVLENLGIKGFTEMQLAEMMGSSVDKDVEGAKPGSANNFFEYGTNVKQLYDFFSTQKDLKVLETSYIANPKAEDLTSENDGLSTADFGNIKPTFSSSSLYASENSDTTEAWVEDAKDSYFVKWLTGHLKEGRPIMVEWGDWDGHWQAIIGYDNNGTPSIGDDVLVFADPYDTSDHWQDGYYFYPLERWFYMWQDRKVAPKPYQLQPYIVVDTVEN